MLRAGRSLQGTVKQDEELDAHLTDDIATISSRRQAFEKKDDASRIVYSRFVKGHDYTRMGSRGIISVNPAGVMARSMDVKSVSREYAQQTLLPSSTDEAALPPHIFEIVSSAYIHLLREKQDQSIVLVGESGSGKTEGMALIARHLCDLSKTSKKKTKIQSAVLRVEFILQAFACAASNSNPNASCVGRYTEYQFDSQGKLVGAKYLDCLLDKRRVTSAALVDGGRSFHIFYQLLAGSSSEEKNQLYLSERADHYAYLNQSHLKDLTVEDARNFEALKEDLKSIGVGSRQQYQIFKLLSAILNLGNVQFVDGDDGCRVRNASQLCLVADLLGVESFALEQVLLSKTVLMGNDRAAVILDTQGAEMQRDALAISLYDVLFSWIMEQINAKLCREEDEWKAFIAVLDMPGRSSADYAGLHELLKEFTSSKIQEFVHSEVYKQSKLFSSEGLYQTGIQRSQTVQSLFRSTPGQKRDPILHHLNVSTLQNQHFLGPDAFPEFKEKISVSEDGTLMTIAHPSGSVSYSFADIFQHNFDTVQSDFIFLVRGSADQSGSTSNFLRALFSDRNVAHLAQEKLSSQASLARSPSTKHRKTKEQAVAEAEKIETTISMTERSLQDFLDTMATTKTWFMFFVRATDGSKNVEPDIVKRQIDQMQLTAFASQPSMKYTAIKSHADFMRRFKRIIPDSVREAGSVTLQCKRMLEYKALEQNEAFVGSTKILMSDGIWKQFEHELSTMQREVVDSHRESYLSGFESDGQRMSDTGSIFSRHESFYAPSDAGSASGTSLYETDMSIQKPFQNLDAESLTLKPLQGKDGVKEKKEPEKKKKSSSLRKKWLCCVWSLTWLVPSPILWICYRQKDRRMAWREKLALCIIIFLLCASILFFIVGLGWIICPKQQVLSPGEITSRNSVSNKPTVQMYGNYYVIDDLIKISQHSGIGVQQWENTILGRDVSQMFSKEPFLGTYCPQFSVPSGFRLFPEEAAELVSGRSWYPHHVNGDMLPRLERYIKGKVVWNSEQISSFAKQESKGILYAYDRIWETTSLLTQEMDDQLWLGDSDSVRRRMHDIIRNYRQGGDATSEMDALKRSAPQEWEKIVRCMDGLFLVGFEDTRNSTQCIFSNYVLLAASIVLVAVIGFKFIAALQFTTSRLPEDHDKFVICQVPCYTEGDVSLQQTLNSLAKLEYDDKRKLLFVICDGMVIGSGNDRPTPRIVLDILGVDATVNPESLAFQSLGEGNKQLNYGKVYSGLYEIDGRVVPFIVVVKVGKESERVKPGNRGKRDSQLLLMRFLSRVHFNQPMCPLELELYHHMKNIIGVDPSFYEFILQVDADTKVMPDSLNRLVSHMSRDSQIAGISGETSLENERATWVTMMQVYEYFISHHMAKAFESLFGTVTCLPGCFSLYRIRSPIKNKPLLVSPGVVADYGENQVDTLHMKNLLSLGEDRYLTTLMMKHFPQCKLKFTADAKAMTVAPEKWSVFLSQRRRWINSTVHNLLELLRLRELCGFCCFSMRFVVFIDLFSTLVQPVALLYIAYLIFLVIWDDTASLPLISLIMIGAIYGFQIILFLIKREWHHLGWMIIYLLSTPIFSFFLPIYSFWHFDDFSWGDTRRLAGKNAKDIADSDIFDPSSIPLKTWEEREEEKGYQKLVQDAQSYYAPSFYDGSQY